MLRSLDLITQAEGLPWWLSSKESTCNAGDAGLIPGSGRSLEERVATHSSILAWRTPWTEEPGGLQSIWVTKSQTRLKGLSMQTCIQQSHFKTYVN